MDSTEDASNSSTKKDVTGIIKLPPCRSDIV